MRRLFFLILLGLSSCVNRPYLGDDVLGAKEFVMDSYQIQKGKFSFMHFEGGLFEPLSLHDLEEYPDQIENGDVILIRLYHPSKHDQIEKLIVFSQMGFTVSDQKLHLPLVGLIHVGGLTMKEAEQVIQQAYREEIEGIEVFLEYRDRLEKRVEIAGMSAIDSLPVNGRLRLFDILAKAKVPPEANLFKSYLVRDAKPLPVDFVQLIEEGDMSQNVVMRAGDKVYIARPDSASLYVMGEVKKEGVIPLRSGSIPIREALAKAGGIAFTGDRAFIQVIRGNLTKPKIYTLTWNHIIHLPTNSMLLIPGDIVYVAATPITQWNRFINQLFPSLTAYEFFNKGIQGVIIQ